MNIGACGNISASDCHSLFCSFLFLQHACLCSFDGAMSKKRTAVDDDDDFHSRDFHAKTQRESESWVFFYVQKSFTCYVLFSFITTFSLLLLSKNMRYEVDLNTIRVPQRTMKRNWKTSNRWLRVWELHHVGSDLLLRYFVTVETARSHALLFYHQPCVDLLCLLQNGQDHIVIVLTNPVTFYRFAVFTVNAKWSRSHSQCSCFG